MRNGQTPTQAAKEAIARIAAVYPDFVGALIAATRSGEIGAACHGIKSFSFCVYSPGIDAVQILTVECI
jgi:N4-(beta-N-acetylglucosaminyl)-L-asparaginase